MITKHLLGRTLQALAVPITLCLLTQSQAQETEYVDFACNEVSDICTVGDEWLYYPGTPVGDSLDVDIFDDNQQFIQLVSTPRQPAILEAAFAIWNGGLLPDDVLRSLPRHFLWTQHWTYSAKTGKQLTEGLVNQSGMVDAGIIHMTSSLPTRLGGLQVHGLRMHVETKCLGDPITNVPCLDYHTFLGGPNINGAVRFKHAKIGSPRVLGDVNYDRLLSAADIDLISFHVGTRASAF